MEEVAVYESEDLIAVADDGVLNVPRTWVRCQVGIKLFDALGDPVLGTSGEFEVTAIGPCSDAEQEIAGSPITVPELQLIDFAMNCDQILVVPDTIVGATHYKICLITNRY